MVREMASTLRPDQDKQTTAVPAAVEQKGRVTMYKKVGCPHCAKAAELLEGKYGLAVTYVDVMTEGQSEEILQQMRTFSGGRNTVPQVFFNSEHLGGNGTTYLSLLVLPSHFVSSVSSRCPADDVQKLDADGVLAHKAEAVRATPVAMMMDHWFHPWY